MMVGRELVFKHIEGCRAGLNIYESLNSSSDVVRVFFSPMSANYYNPIGFNVILRYKFIKL
jgi:hypothetical protein